MGEVTLDLELMEESCSDEEQEVAVLLPMENNSASQCLAGRRLVHARGGCFVITRSAAA